MLPPGASLRVGRWALHAAPELVCSVGCKRRRWRVGVNGSHPNAVEDTSEDGNGLSGLVRQNTVPPWNCHGTVGPLLAETELHRLRWHAETLRKQRNVLRVDDFIVLGGH